MSVEAIKGFINICSDLTLGFLDVLLYVFILSSIFWYYLVETFLCIMRQFSTGDSASKGELYSMSRTASPKPRKSVC